MVYLPEGKLLQTAQNKMALSSFDNLKQAMENKTILEAKAILCDSEHNLIVDLNGIKGIIPKNEGAVGIAEGTTRDIALISRVNKPVCFVIESLDKGQSGEVFATLSRKKAQMMCNENYIKKLKCGDVIDAVVTHMEPFGCFVDIGCGLSSLVPIDTISISRICHPSDRFSIGQNIRAVVKSLDGDYRISLTHKELLGTWEENASNFHAGETVIGIVRSVEKYGIFIELAPNLAGLAELKDDVFVGQQVSVYIKSLIPEKMKIKLIIVDTFKDGRYETTTEYRTDTNHIDYWRYSPLSCAKVIESKFE